MLTHQIKYVKIVYDQQTVFCFFVCILIYFLPQLIIIYTAFRVLNYTVT